MKWVNAARKTFTSPEVTAHFSHHRLLLIPLDYLSSMSNCPNHPASPSQNGHRDNKYTIITPYSLTDFSCETQPVSILSYIDSQELFSAVFCLYNKNPRRYWKGLESVTPSSSCSLPPSFLPSLPPSISLFLPVRFSWQLNEIKVEQTSFCVSSRHGERSITAVPGQRSNRNSAGIAETPSATSAWHRLCWHRPGLQGAHAQREAGIPTHFSFLSPFQFLPRPQKWRCLTLPVCSPLCCLHV